jgi:CubicO group peptidase (beta-lactamase class C family)
MKHFFVLAIFILLTFTTKGDNPSKKLNKILTKISKTSEFAGFAVSTITDDKVTFQKSYGFANIEAKIEYNNDTQQPIASVSKTLIGLAMMKAIEQSLFTLETPVNEILPFKITNPNQPNTPILIRHLSSHTSSILDSETGYSAAYYVLPGENINTPIAKRLINEFGANVNKEIMPVADFLKNYFSVNGTNYSINNFDKNPIGSTYNYSNIGAALAAYIIEYKAGISYKAFCKKYIFDPIGMANTTWQPTSQAEKTTTKLYSAKAEPLPAYGCATFADGGLVTTNTDLTKFLLEMMAGYYGKGTILSKESYKTLFEKQFDQTKLPTNLNPKELNSGHFWVYFKNGKLGHTGSDLGVTTFMAFDPNTKKGFIFLSNSEMADLEDNVKIIGQFQQINTALKEFQKTN